MKDNERDKEEFAEQEYFNEVLLNTVPAIIHLIDVMKRKNEFISAYSYNALGYMPDEIIQLGSNFIKEIMHPDDQLKLPSHFEEIIASADNTIHYLEYRMLHKNNKWQWFLSKTVIYKRDQEGQVIQILGVALDITEAKEREILLQKLAREDERRRLALELHDAVKQSLFASSVLADALPALAEQNHPSLIKDSQMIARLNRASLADMNIVLLKLYPESITSSSLHELIRDLCDSLQGHKTLSTSFSSEGKLEAPLPVDHHLNIYRIAQECFNNIRKHSEATQVDVTLNISANSVNLLIQDNGVGFDTEIFASGMGLKNMRERANAISATLTLISGVGEGTTLNLSYPLSD